MKKLAILIFALSISLSIPLALAQDGEQQDYGLNINPFIIESDVAKGETSSGSVTVTNWSDDTLQVTVTPKDFVPNHDTGQPVFVPDDEMNDKTFSLAQWVSFPEGQTFKLNPQESKEVKYALSPPEDAEQGSHYGALLFSYRGSERNRTVGQITPTIGSVILVRYGQAREMGETGLASKKSVMFTNDSFEFSTKFTNSGNVHVKPKGEIYFKNLFGKVVASVPVNRDAEVLLPGVGKTFESKWYPSGLSFGRYVAEVSMEYGKNRLEAKDQVVVWVLPIHLVVGFIVFVGGILWFCFRGIHIYNRWLLRQIEKK